MNQKPQGTVTQVIYAQEPEKIPEPEPEPEPEKPKFSGIGFKLGKEKGNARDIMGSIEYKDDQKCQKKTQKEQCITPCVWNESQEPHCRYEDVIQKISEVTTKIISDSEDISDFTDFFKKFECLRESDCAKIKKRILVDAKRIHIEITRLLHYLDTIPDSDDIRDRIFAEVAAVVEAALATSPKSSPKSAAAVVEAVLATSPKSSPRTAAALAPERRENMYEWSQEDSEAFNQAYATSPKSSPRTAAATNSPVSVAATNLVSYTYSWFASGVDFFTRVREEKEHSAEELKKLEEKESDFYQQNIDWLKSENAAAKAKKEKEDADRAEKEKEIKDQIAALQKRIKEKEDAARAKEDAARAEKEKENAAARAEKEKEIAALKKRIKEKEDAARAKEDAARAEEDAKYTAARNERLKYIATSAWSSMGTMIAGALDLSKGVIKVGIKVGNEGIKVGKKVGKYGKEVGKYGIVMAIDGFNNLIKTLDENNKRAAKDAARNAARDAAARDDTRKPARNDTRKAAIDADAKKPARNDTRKAADAKKPARNDTKTGVYMGESNQNHQTADFGDSGDSDNEVVFIGVNQNPKREATATLTRIPSAAASPPSPPPQAPTCEAIMDEEPCEGAKIGTYGCNWMDGRRPLCLQSQSNKNNEGIQQIFNKSNTESWSEAKVANYINDPTSPIYQFWRRGRNALITRWAKERHFGDDFMGTKATTNKRGYRTKGGNRKTKKRNNKRNNKK